MPSTGRSKAPLALRTDADFHGAGFGPRGGDRRCGAFVFGGALDDADKATVIRSGTADVMMTDGPFVESKEYLGGFYVIEADDLDDALDWARKVVMALEHPIEIRPFRATGRLKDYVPGSA